MPDELADEALRSIEAWDDAADNFCAEVCKYEPHDFPPQAIAAMQESADRENAHRRQVLRDLRKLVAGFRALRREADEIKNRPVPVPPPVESSAGWIFLCVVTGMTGIALGYFIGRYP